MSRPLRPNLKGPTLGRSANASGGGGAGALKRGPLMKFGKGGGGNPLMRRSASRGGKGIFAKKQHQQTIKVSADDDDEDDVETMSISSEDSDDGQKGRDDAQFDESAWDEVEPSTWDRVDTEALVREVRELRDARGDAAVSGIKKASTITLAFDSDQITELRDPMGMGLINMHTLTLESKSQGAKLIEDPEALAKIINYEETFDPAFYLSRVHAKTDMEELQEGLNTLQRDLLDSREHLKTMVKNNFDCFISCKVSIEEIQRGVSNMEKDKSGTSTLILLIKGVDELAQRAFGPLLERQNQVDRIRSVQGLLLRFRTLFNLPKVIREFIHKKEYDSAVHEYLKARTIALPNQSKILKKVLEEVQKVAQEFTEVLYQQIDDPNADQAKIENTIRLLLSMQPESDPIWHYLTLQDRRIRGLLEGAARDFERMMGEKESREREMREADARWKKIQRESYKGTNFDINLLLGPEEEEGDEREKEREEEGGRERIKSDTNSTEEIDLLHSQLIHRLTLILRNNLPRFLRLAHSIFAGKFAAYTKALPAAVAPKNEPKGRKGAAADQSKGSAGASKYQKHSKEEMTVLILGILFQYELKVQRAFSSLEKTSELRPYMREAVNEVSSLCSVLGSLEACPRIAVEALFNLRIDLIRRFVSRLCHVTRLAAAELAEDADVYVPGPTSLRLGSPFAISRYPTKFRDRMSSALEHVSEVLSPLTEHSDAASAPKGPGSNPGSRKDPGSNNDNLSVAPDPQTLVSMYNAVKTTFFESFMDYCECLTKMAQSLPLPSSNSEQAQSGEDGAANDGATPGTGTSGTDSSASFSGLQVGVELVTSDQKILMLLSNAGFCRKYVATELADKFRHLWVDPSRKDAFRTDGPSLDEAERLIFDIEKAFIDLETQLGDQYIAIKAGDLGMAVIKYFLEDGTSWATAPPVKGLRDSALELMHPLVAVHAEVHAGCRPFVSKSINTLCEGLMDALHQVALQHEDLQKLDANAFCQLSLELDYFENVLSSFSSSALEEIIFQLREMLLMRAMEGIEASAGEGHGEGRGRRGRGGGGEDYEDRDMPTPQTQEDLRLMANNMSADLLPAELLRTKINTLCFSSKSLESSLPYDGTDGFGGGSQGGGSHPGGGSNQPPAMYTPNSAPPIPGGTHGGVQYGGPPGGPQGRGSQQATAQQQGGSQRAATVGPRGNEGYYNGPAGGGRPGRSYY